MILGGAGNDKLYGSKGKDLIDGEDGDDYIYSQGGADILFGGRGNDRIKTSGYNNIIVGGEGNDDVSGKRKSNDVYAFDHHGSSSEDFASHGNYSEWSKKSNTYVGGDLDEALRIWVTQQFLTTFTQDFARADLTYDVAGTSSLRFAMTPFILSISAP